MLRWFVLLAGLLLATPAAADMYPDASNAKLPEARTNLGITEINFRDYGAKGDGIADDTAAINAAFGAWKAAIAAGGSPTLKCDAGTYRVTGSVGVVEGMPHMGSRPVKFSAWGCTITSVDGSLWGKVVVDLRGNTFLTIEGLNIYASADVGLAWGRYRDGGEYLADQVHLNGVTIIGGFAIAACYNSTSEIGHATNLDCTNTGDNPASYGLILDGMNHFNVASAFMTVTLPVDVPSSLQTFLCTDCNIAATNGSNAALWLSPAVYSPRFIGGYFLQYMPGLPVVELYDHDNAQPISDPCFDTHFETSSNYSFLISGPATAVTIQGFCYRDNVVFSTAAIFGRDNPAKTVTINDLRLAVGWFYPASIPIYDDPSKYTVRPVSISMPPGYSIKFPKITQLVAAETPTPLTSTTTFLHAGFGSQLTFTPLSSTNTTIQACTTARNDTAGDGEYLRLAIGTGTPPALGAAPAGIVYGAQNIALSAANNDRKTVCWPEIPVTGLQLGVPFWVDVGVNVIFGGNVRLETTQVTFKEVP